MACTLVSSSPALKIFTPGIHVLAKWPLHCYLYPPSPLIGYCVKCSVTIVYPFPSIHKGNWNQALNVSSPAWDGQFISSFAMSKVVANNKLPNKSVNRLPYGLFTPKVGWAIPLSWGLAFAYTGVSPCKGYPAIFLEW